MSHLVICFAAPRRKTGLKYLCYNLDELIFNSFKITYFLKSGNLLRWSNILGKNECFL